MEDLQKIFESLISNNISPYYVGGYVRDKLLAIENNTPFTPKDIDIVLVGATSADQVTDILACEQVGKDFPIWKKDVNGEIIDFALARKERSTGGGHNDFECEVLGVSLEDDLFRRDLTINAMAEHCITGDLTDPFEGLRDLRHKIAYPVSNHFSEDPLRVLRAARFIARFDLASSWKLEEVCRNIDLTQLDAERVGGELEKLFEQTDTPSLFFDLLQEVGHLEYWFTELHALLSVEQDPTYHPEGNAYRHTMHCIDQAKDPFTRCVMLCHDLGKATTTEFVNGRWRSPKHDIEGVKPTLDMLSRIKFKNKKIQKQLALLVELHMIHINKPSRRSVFQVMRKLHKLDLTFAHLVEVCRCDVSGRPPLPGYTPDIGQDIAFEATENPSLLTPVVNGDMLMKDFGVPAGPRIGWILQRALKSQDKGNLTPENYKSVVEQLIKSSKNIDK